jgi:hypothetical protein
MSARQFAERLRVPQNVWSSAESGTHKYNAPIEVALGFLVSFKIQVGIQLAALAYV